MRTWFLVALASSVWWPPLASAQSPPVPHPDSIYVLEEVNVSSARKVVTVGGASAISASPDSVAAAPSPTLGDVLRQLPLIQVRENSRGEAQPQLRGMESRRVAVMVDGIPLTLGWDNRTDLGVIPVTAARELTLVRGLSSVLHGPNALGGVVLISMSDELNAPMTPLRIDAGVDHLGSSAFAAGLARQVRGAAGTFTVRAGGGYRDRKETPLAAGVAQPPPGNDSDRLNSDFRLGNGYLVTRYQAKSGTWGSVSSFAFGSERGVAPELHVNEPRLWRYPKTSRWVTAISGGSGLRKTPWGRGHLRASIGVDHGRTEISTFTSLAYDTINGGETGDDRVLSARLLGDHSLGTGTLRGAATFAEARHDERILPDERARYRQRLWSFGLEHEQPILYGGPVSPRARLSAGVSADGSDTPETGGRTARGRIWDWGARAGGTFALGNGEAWLHGGWSRRVRFPALRELYSGSLGRFAVNESLQPEVLSVTEIGLTFRRPGYELQVVGFHQRLSDAIVRVSLGDGRLQRQNRDEVRSTGVELIASYALQPFTASASATLKDVTQKDPLAPDAQSRPEYQPDVTADLELSFPLGFGVTGSGKAQYVGERYCVHPDLGTDVRLAADAWLDLSLARRFGLSGGRQCELRVSLSNVTDAASFDQCGLPQPGRLARFQLRVF